ncbi:MAG: hypothetical protein U0Q18_13290 [Bryobacteraceae bacterium]
MRLRFCAAIALWAGSLFGADPGLLSLAMPDARVMAGVNFDQTKSSPFGQFLLAQAAREETGLQVLIGTTGFDPRRDVREVLMASTGQGGQQNGVLLIRGTFDVARIVGAALSGDKPVEEYMGVQVIGFGNGGHGSLALLDSTLAIAGTDPEVRAAIDRKSTPAAIPSDLAVRVNQLSTTSDVWFVSLVPLAQLKPQMAPEGETPRQPDMVNKVQQASLSVKFGSNVALTAQTVSPTAQDATALADMVRFLSGMAKMNAARDPSAAGLISLLEAIIVKTDGAVTTLSLTVPEQQIEQMIDAGSVPGAKI